MKPPGECLKSSEWFVADCDQALALSLIVRHHYARGASNTSTNTHGLYRKTDMALFGVTWWLPPIRGAALSVCKAKPKSVLSLSRLVILPDAPKNSATFLLARSERLLSPAWEVLLTYADTWQGHTGTIYRASGWKHLGLTKPEPIYQIDGRMVSRKAGPRTRSHAEMLAMGAVYIGKFPRHKFKKARQPKAKASPNSHQHLLPHFEVS